MKQAVIQAVELIIRSHISSLEQQENFDKI
jgi:hypothetical protein